MLTLDIPKEELLRLANQWEPEASAAPPGYRKATCAGCGAEMVEMWHCWLHEGGFKKEIHLCWTCGEPWVKTS